MARGSDNQALYDFGSQCARRGTRSVAVGTVESDSISEVATALERGVAEVRTAYQFAHAVDAVVAAVGPAARETILAGDNPHLTPKVVIAVSRRPSDHIRAAIDQAARGLHPFAPPPPKGLPDEDARWHHDLTRLCRAADLLDQVAGVVTGSGFTLPASAAEDLTRHAIAVRAGTDALRLVLVRERGQSAENNTPSTQPTIDPTRIVAVASQARRLVEAVSGDLLRAAHSGPPKDAARRELADAVRRTADAAGRVAAALPVFTDGVDPPLVVTEPAGPDNRGGTYVVVLRADAPGVIQIGRLGTFWLPDGHLLYVGSAFGGGGVRSRTARHTGGTGPRLWNLDHLRDFARPVELWWTHQTERVECAWAMALASLPGACCPAPRCGANDCKRCPAHLLRTAGRPSCAAFARRLGQAGSGGYTVYRQVLPENTRSPGPTVAQTQANAVPGPPFTFW